MFVNKLSSFSNETTMTEYNVIRKLFYIVIGCCICIPIYPYNRRNVRIWSNKPAYTQVMENENERGITSDIYDGLWEGDSVPILPRVLHPSFVIKRWQQEEEQNYLNEETNALTHGKYVNPV